MIKYEVDARGLDCPKPVIETKKMIDKIESGIIVVMVDNEIARENVRKFVQSKNISYSIEEKNGDYHIILTKGDSEESFVKQTEVSIQKSENDNLVIYIESNKMGEGSDELGEILMKSYLYTLTELDILPKSIVLVNVGVYLAINSSPVIDYLKDIEKKGVEIISCGTCLNYYNIQDQLGVGIISNMYSIIEELHSAERIIRI